MKIKFTRQIVYIILFVIGLGLMIGGIMTRKHGATVIGIIVAAVIVQQWIQWNNEKTNKNKSSIS